MRRILVTIALAVALGTGCSGTGGTAERPERTASGSTTGSSTGSAASPTVAVPSDATGEPAPLAALWENPLVVPPAGLGTGGVAAVSERHVLATADVDDSPGTTNPLPQVALDYGIADAETGAVVVVEPLAAVPGTIRAVPGTDLFVAVAGGRVAVLDAARAAYSWKRPAIGEEVVSMTATRLWMGRDTPTGRPRCLTVDTGSVVADAACREAASAGDPVVDGIRVSAGTQVVLMPNGEEIDVPVTSGWPEGESTPAWTRGETAVRVEDGAVGYESSEFLVSGLGLVRVDYRRDPDPAADPDLPLVADAVLQLVDARTGEVTRALGRVTDGIVVGFAGDVAVVEHRSASGATVAGYRLAS